MRPIALTVLALFVAATAASARPQASVLGEPPGQPPPAIGNLAAPPPAWVETARGSRWLGYSSFCWGTTCADFSAPRCGDVGHTPTLRLRRGETVRFHLGFLPVELGLTFFGRDSRLKGYRLALRRTAAWHVDQRGVFSLFARAKADGDASYVGCVRFR
jgi:hypothetical protein